MKGKNKKESKYNELLSLFDPENIAVIGANHEKGKVGYSIFKTLKESLENGGEVIPVNPNADEILGQQVYDSVKDIPQEVDLAVIAIPAKITPKIIEECGEAGVEAAIVISSGFSEIGNKKLEEKLREKAEESSIRLLGPNCLGILDNTTGLNTLFLPREKLGIPEKGKIAVVSQSGAVGSVIVDWASTEHFGLSRFISYGNATDIEEHEILEFLGEDPETDAIAVYLEGTTDGRKFMEVAEEVTEKKPIVVLKAGETEKGSRAVSSHTGSLAGSREVYRAAFKQSNIIQAKTILDLIDYTKVFENQPPAKGNKILIVTNGGGFGVLSTDEVIEQGMELAEIPSRLENDLEEILPEYAKVRNPLDLMGDAGPERYEKILKEFEDVEEIDAVLCIGLMQTVSMSEEVIDSIFKFDENSDIPIVVSSAGGEKVHDIRAKLEKGGVPVFDTPHRAVDALKALVEYSAN